MFSHSGDCPNCRASTQLKLAVPVKVMLSNKFVIPVSLCLIVKETALSFVTLNCFEVFLVHTCKVGLGQALLVPYPLCMTAVTLHFPHVCPCSPEKHGHIKLMTVFNII